MRQAARVGTLLVMVIVAGVRKAASWITERQASSLSPRQAEACWIDEPEEKNPRQRRDPKPMGELPEPLRQMATPQSTVLFKLCVGVDGGVERVIVVRSSGSAEVDDHYARVLSTWEFPPHERAATAVRSVVPVTVVLH